MAKESFGEEEKGLLERLEEYGLQKDVARALVFIASSEDATSREIENGTRLRQPEASIATKILRDKGWVEKRNVNREGKGRPVHIYSLNKPMKSIMEELEEDQKKRIQDMEENMSEIKSIVDSLY